MESIKDRIKEKAKPKGLKMADIAASLKLTQQGMYKAFREKTLSLIQLERISEILQVHITDILPSKQQNLNIAGERIATYGTRIDNNKFFSGTESEFVKLKTENELLRQQIEKQDKEIEFLRGQLMK